MRKVLLILLLTFFLAKGLFATETISSSYYTETSLTPEFHLRFDTQVTVGRLPERTAVRKITLLFPSGLSLDDLIAVGDTGPIEFQKVVTHDGSLLQFILPQREILLDEYKLHLLFTEKSLVSRSEDNLIIKIPTFSSPDSVVETSFLIPQSQTKKSFISKPSPIKVEPGQLHWNINDGQVITLQFEAKKEKSPTQDQYLRPSVMLISFGAIILILFLKKRKENDSN